MMTNDPGVYYILNTHNNRIYIGQSRHIRERIRQHKAALRSGYHSTKSLQHDYIEYGLDAFEFGLLVVAYSESQLNRLERIFIRVYQSESPTYGYNINAQTESRKVILRLMAQGNYTTRPRKRTSRGAPP